MKNRFLVIGAFLALVVCMVGGYTYYQSQRKEVQGCRVNQTDLS